MADRKKSGSSDPEQYGITFTYYNALILGLAIFTYIIDIALGKQNLFSQ